MSTELSSILQETTEAKKFCKTNKSLIYCINGTKHCTSTNTNILRDMCRIIQSDNDVTNTKIQIDKIMGNTHRDWNNLSDFFHEVHSGEIDYAFLYNSEKSLLADGKEQFIDLLISSLWYPCCIMTNYLSSNHNCKTNVLNQNQHLYIEGQLLHIGLHIVGDDYYDVKWMRDMLSRRIWNEKGYYVLSEDDNLFSLIYHSLIHINYIPGYYIPRLKRIVESSSFDFPFGVWSEATMRLFLDDAWMKPNGYKYTKPLHNSIPFNFKPTEKNAFDKFYQTLRVSSNSTYLLVYKTRQGVGGFGSRLLGIANTFIWSVLTNRKFCIDYNTPQPLTDVFKPNKLHWHCSLPTNKSLVLNYVDRTAPEHTLENEDLNEAWNKSATVMCYGCNMPSIPILLNNPNYKNRFLETGLGSLIKKPNLPIETNCVYQENKCNYTTQFYVWPSMVWNLLFQPSEELIQYIMPTLNKIKQADFSIGFHIRLGGTVGNSPDSIRKHNKPVLEWFISCGLFHSPKSGNVVWYIAADHRDMIMNVSNGIKTLTHIEILHVSISTPVHIDRSKYQTHQQWIETVADWWLIGETDIILKSPSSFSLTSTLFHSKMPLQFGSECNRTLFGLT